MKQNLVLIAMAALVLSGCASGPGGIYAPSGSSASQPRDTVPAPQPPQVADRDGGEDTPQRRERLSEQPAGGSSASPVQPGFREQGDALSPAARSLIAQADQMMAQGNYQGAVSQLERAQRISPRSAEVYYKLSEAYVAMDNLGAAEQFTLKGLSVTGTDTRLQKAGWNLLADIRRARGNVAGADQAEQRAQSL